MRSAPIPALFAFVAAVVIVAAGVGACAEIRTATSPPDFRQLEREEIHSAMQQMAKHVRELDDTLRDDTAAEPDKQQRVLAALDGIHANASGLRPSGATLSHPMLEEKLPGFLRDVEGARQAAANTPPQYFLAGSVAGSCMACHRGK